MKVYLREQPRYHFTSTERETKHQPRPYRHHMATHPLNPARCRPQKPGDHNECRRSSPKAEKSATGYLQLACRTHLPKTSYHTHHPPRMFSIRPTTTMGTTSQGPLRINSARIAATLLPQSAAEEAPADMKTVRYPQRASRHLPLRSQKKIGRKEIRQTCS